MSTGISFGVLVHQLLKASQISASLKTNFIYKKKKCCYKTANILMENYFKF